MAENYFSFSEEILLPTSCCENNISNWENFVGMIQLIEDRESVEKVEKGIMIFLIGVYPFSTYAKSSEKLTFLTP